MELPILTRGPNVPPFATEVLDKCPTSTFMQPYSLTSMVILSTYLCVCLLLQFWSWYKWRVTFEDEEEAPWNAFSWVVWLFRSTRPSRPSSIRTFPGSKMKPKNQQRRLLKVYLFFKRAFILKDNQRRSICQQARVPSHSSEGADMGVRKHISRLSLSQSLSHFRTHSFPQFEKKRGHTCVHSTQNRKDCVEETLIIALGFNAKWDRHCPTPALF